MKAVILAGGRGLRFDEETHRKPKPMIEVGGKPMLWHIMSIYRQHGIRDFVVCVGYMGDMIREYFANFAYRHSDLTIDLRTGKMKVHSPPQEDWRVTIVDTGLDTQTGGRLKRVSHLLDETFLMTYGDGVSDVDISATIDFHRRHRKLATVTAVTPPGRWGALRTDTKGRVTHWEEKPARGGGVINGGFFVLQRKVLDLIEDDSTEFEFKTLMKLVAQGELMAYQHDGYWQAMDTAKDRALLESHWNDGDAPWLKLGRRPRHRLVAVK